MSSENNTKQAILQALQGVTEPQSGRDVVALGLARGIAYGDGVARITYELPPQIASPETQMRLREQTETALNSLADVREVKVDFKVVEQRATNILPGVKHVIAIGAGKGGVGKSTVAVLAAVGLQRLGRKVGLLDADVYGPSLPKLTGTEGAQPQLNEHGRIIPPEFAGIKIISMGYLVPPSEAVIWRGPLAQKYVKEFLERGDWGELDYLIVDLPPGTGDIPLTLAQSIPLTGAVVVCTPQDLAVVDAVKALRMFQKLDVTPLGMVENMSSYVCPHCGERDYLFGQGGARKAAAELGVPFLGEIPLNVMIRELGDQGRPFDNFTRSDKYVVEALEQIVTRLGEEVTKKSKQGIPLPQLNSSG